MKCRHCDGKGSMPGSRVSITLKSGIKLVEVVCPYCYNGEIPGQTEYWLCRCDSLEEPVFLHEGKEWFYYEPGEGWLRVKQDVVPIRRMVQK